MEEDKNVINNSNNAEEKKVNSNSPISSSVVKKNDNTLDVVKNNTNSTSLEANKNMDAGNVNTKVLSSNKVDSNLENTNKNSSNSSNDSPSVDASKTIKSNDSSERQRLLAQMESIKNRYNSATKKKTIKSNKRINYDLLTNDNEADVLVEKKPLWKRLMFAGFAVLFFLVLIIGGYVGYLQAAYSRIIDYQALEPEGNIAKFVDVGESYSIMTYNLGFGAYSENFSFFMDEGKYAGGNKTSGKYSKALSRSAVEKNTKNAIDIVKSSPYDNVDFYFFQEVDNGSNRSYFVDQKQIIKDSFENYASIFASNAHSAYLFYPITKPIGKINSGIVTLSKYYAYYATRRSLPIDNGFFNKFFDLDRCISVTKIKMESHSSKFLVLINVHLSAYDDGSIREEQLELLYSIMDEEYKQNKNYVIVGGDFNHALYGESGVFENNMEMPDWLQYLPDEYGVSKLENMGYTINIDADAVSKKLGTCRDSSVAYEKGSTLEVIIDGFITSDNIRVDNLKIVDGKYLYSDHNPVYMQFTLI